MKQINIALAVGGTGGHIYPAIALADQIKAVNPHINILFIGGKLSTNLYFNRSGYNWKEICSSSINLKNPFKLILQLVKIAKGIAQSRTHLKDIDLIIGFGSYYSFPALVAARSKKIPIFLHEQNSIPGRVNRLISPFATLTGAHFSETLEQLTGNCMEISIPLRQGYKKNSVSSLEARNYFSLNPHKQTLLVFGGSQGAEIINQNVIEALTILKPANLQVIHIVGSKNDTSSIKKRYELLSIPNCVKEFESNMNFAWQASDFIISRSGAGTIAEQTEFEIPSILIPFQHAMDNHQEKNADFMVKKIGSAIKLREKELNPHTLAEKINELMNDEIYTRMKNYIVQYKQKKSVPSFVDIIINFLKK